MATVRYGQVESINSVLSKWWQVGGLSVAFQRQVLAVMRCLAEQNKELDELRKKFIDDYAKKDADGNPVANNDVYVFADPAAATARWLEIINAGFECPYLAVDHIDQYAEKLGLTIEQMAIIETILDD